MTTPNDATTGAEAAYAALSPEDQAAFDADEELEMIPPADPTTAGVVPTDSTTTEPGNGSLPATPPAPADSSPVEPEEIEDAPTANVPPENIPVAPPADPTVPEPGPNVLLPTDGAHDAEELAALKAAEADAAALKADLGTAIADEEDEAVGPTSTTSPSTTTPATTTPTPASSAGAGASTTDATTPAASSTPPTGSVPPASTP